MYKLILIIISFLVIEGCYCYTPGMGSDNHDSNDKKASRCKGIEGVLNENCQSSDRTISGRFSTTGGGGEIYDYNTVIIKRNYNNIYQMACRRCSPNYSLKSPDGCNQIFASPPVDIDTDSIAPTVEDCKNKKYWQSFSNAGDGNMLKIYLKNKVCLAYVKRDDIKTYAKDFKLNEDIRAVCAFELTGGRGDVKTDKTLWTALGCTKIKRAPPPPPFTKGVVPITSTLIPFVNGINDIAKESTFQKPIAVIETRFGNDTLNTEELTLDLINNQYDRYETLQYKACDQNEYCTTLNSVRPDILKILLNDIEIATYPRPAIEQKENQLSFFPCYHTYKNENNDLFQGIYVFSINISKGQQIGEDLYLGPNYLPSTSADKVGNIVDTKCDLCINAANTQGITWPGNIYKDGYNGGINTPISACKLNSSLFPNEAVEIKRIKLLDKGGGEIKYPQSLEEAPLRLDMFDIYEQKQNILNVLFDYTYQSESAILDKYLVSVRPIIPLFNADNEAAYIAAIQDSQATCNIYHIDKKGLMFITPAGKRDREFCTKNNQIPNALFTLCNTAKQVEYDSICPGIYSGSSDAPSDKPSIQSDKICLMSNGNWDFLTGRYVDDSTISLNNKINGEDKIIPGMACSFLPACKSLGNNLIPNVGHAIWNIEATFNTKVTGICKSIDYSRTNIEHDEYTYQYDMDNYEMLNPTIEIVGYNKEFEDILSELKTENKTQPYISEEALKKYTELAIFYENAKKQEQSIFKCTKKLPTARCIGGIYGDVKKDTECVSIKTNGVAVKCEVQ